MPVNCISVINLMNQIAPQYLAQDWDNVGLQIGNEDSIVNNIMVCLDLTKDVLMEAIEKNVDMIITHHPIIFKPIKQLTTSDPTSNIIMELIKNDINLYCAHTNLDIAVGGTSDYIAHLLNLKNVEPLSITHKEKYYKLVVFVPRSSAEKVMNSISSVGAGNIGNYSHCTFQSLGKGTFKPLEGSEPYIGTINNLETVEEVKLETIVSSSNLQKVIDSMLSAHPYEEVAYDIYMLENEYNKYGFGRIGYLENKIGLKDLALKLKESLQAQSVKIISSKDKLVEKIAICTGSGGEFIKRAISNNCDCYITGDIKYHEAQYALESNLSIIDAGHFETENVICKYIKECLQNEFSKQNESINILLSEVNTNPFYVLV